MNIVACSVLGLMLIAPFGGLWFHNNAQLNQMGAQEDEFRSLFKEIEAQTAYRVLVTSGFRSNKAQARLHKQNSKNAKPGRSKHNHRLAMDINLVKFGQIVRKADSKELWLSTGVPQLAKDKGFRWGGDFRGYHDPVHFELRR